MLATERRDRLSLRWILVVGLLAVVAFASAIAIQRNVFPYYSGDHDEPVYRYQADMMRDGDLNVPLAQNEFFRPWLSGPRDDHLVMAFGPGWPAVLMVADVTTGSMLVGLGFAAALTVVAGFGFARELLGSAGRAALATAILSLSPFVLMLSGTYLSYVIGLALYLVFGALLLRALRTDSPILLVLAGFVIGGAFLTRPYDAVLFAVPFAVYIVATRRHDRAKLAKIAGWFALGLAPTIVIALLYNLATTGTLLEFPVSVQSGGFSKFGFGIRSIGPDTPKLNYTVQEAVESMGTNLWAVPTWLFGTYLTLALSAYGAFRLWKAERAICGLLLGLTFIFPVGYLAWWASSLTTNGALTGLGPHYYVPMLVPLAIFAAYGIAELAVHRRAVLIGGVVVAIVLTGIAVQPKIAEQRRVAKASRIYSHQLQRGLKQRDGQPALVIQERRKSSYIMEPYPFLANPPDLKADVLYARDRGPLNVDLIDRTKDRRVYRIVRELAPGNPLGQLPVVLKPQSVQRGSTLVVHSRIVNTSGKSTVTAYARLGKDAQRRVLDTRSARGDSYDVEWTLSPHGLTYHGPAALRIKPLKAGKVKGQLVIGASFAKSTVVRDPDAVERRYYARITRDGAGGVELLTADEEWTRFGAPVHAWLPITVNASLQVRITTTP
jgi:Dolichyl-phosphate-mannose-protein mannosyltransferase